MFQTKDYLSYFDQILLIEKNMVRDGRLMLKAVKEPEAQELLKHLVEDEKKHVKIVKALKKIIKSKYA